jgi:hypothetical protein
MFITFPSCSHHFHISPSFSHHLFSHHFPIIFPSFSHHFPIIFPSFSHHIPIIFPSFFHHVPIIVPSFSHHIPIIFPLFFHHIPIIFQLFVDCFLFFVPGHLPILNFQVLHCALRAPRSASIAVDGQNVVPEACGSGVEGKFAKASGLNMEKHNYWIVNGLWLLDIIGILLDC